MEIVFHRAIDQAVNPLGALDALFALGVKRILTSGQAPRAAAGIPTLKAMVQAGSGLEIMAGGGVRIDDIPALRDQAGVSAIHLSAKAKGAAARSAALALGSADGTDPNAYFVTDEELVRAAVRRLTADS